jgi:pimeloyl-ACP methyl ester carboxylesterase
VLVRDVGSGRPILLVNGLGAHTAMWSTLESRLQGFRVISFDAPGAGRSPSPRLPMSLKRLARLATHVLDHFEVDRADVLGYSMGGMIVQQLCAEVPERVRRVVLVATSPGVGGFHGNIVAMLNLVVPARYLSPHLYRLTIGSMVGGRARNDPEWIGRHTALRMRYAPTIGGYMRQLAALTGWSSLPLLSTIPHPVLVIAGDDDPLTPILNSMLITNRIQNARLQILEGEGHLMLMDEDSLAHPTIRQFLAADKLDSQIAWRAARAIDNDTLRRALADPPKFQIQPYGLLGSMLRNRYLNHTPNESERASPTNGGSGLGIG